MKLNIISTKEDDGENLPYCSPLVYEHLEKAYSLGSLMTHNFKNNDEHIGYIQGVMDVLGHIKMLAEIDKE